MPSEDADRPEIAGIQLTERRRRAGSVQVWSGTDQLGLPVAVHICPLAKLGDDFDADAFLGRVRIAAGVQHEALLPFVTGGTSGDSIYAVAKAVDAPGLDDLIARGGGLAEERALKIAAEVSGALAALERNGMRHGDLTPRRIRLPGRGAVRVRPPRIAPPRLAPLPVRYQAPEEARGGEGDIRSDLFVLGLILAESISGKYPLDGGANAIEEALRKGQLPSVAQLVPRSGPGTRAILARLLAADPTRRFASAAQAAADIYTAATGEAPESIPVVDAIPIAEPEPADLDIPVAVPVDEERPETAPIGRMDANAVVAAAKSGGSKAASKPAPKSKPKPKAAAKRPAAAVPDVRAFKDAAAAIRRTPGRLFLQARLGEARLELEEDVFVGRPPSAIDLHARPEPFPEAVFNIEREPSADVLHVLRGPVTVNGQEVRRHELTSGDRIEADGVSGRYDRGAREALRATGAGGPAPNAGLARGVLAAAIILTIAVLGWAGMKLTGGGDPAAEAVTEAASATAEFKAARAAAVEKTIPGSPASTKGSGASAARSAFESARSWARKNRNDTAGGIRRFAEIADTYPDSAYAVLARGEVASLERGARLGEGARLEALLGQATQDAAEGLLDDALLKLKRFAEANPGTIDAERARRTALDLRNEIRGRFETDMATVDAAIRERNWRIATQVAADVMEYVPLSLRDRALRKKREVKSTMEQLLRGGAPTVPGGDETAGGGDNSGGGAPDNEPPDANKAARVAYRSAARAMGLNQNEIALAAFIEFLKAHKGTPEHKKRKQEVYARVRTLAQTEAGVILLFRGKVQPLPKGRYRFTYDFEDPAQIDDFIDVNAFEAPPRANWTIVSGAVRAKGSGALKLNCKFGSDFLTAAITVTPERPSDLGIMFFEPDEPRRHYLYTLQNSFFTLGKPGVKETFREHAIVLFGPGMWRDTPEDEIGYVRKCGVTEPKLRATESLRIKAAKASGEVWLRFGKAKTIRGSAYGDIKYEFKGLEPALFVLNSSSYFDEFEVEGTPDSKWVTDRWNQILADL